MRNLMYDSKSNTLTVKKGQQIKAETFKGKQNIHQVIFEGSDLFEMTYNQAATLHRINLGWRRRKEESQKGFMLDVNSGNWIRNNNEV